MVALRIPGVRSRVLVFVLGAGGSLMSSATKANDCTDRWPHHPLQSSDGVAKGALRRCAGYIAAVLGHMLNAWAPMDAGAREYPWRYVWDYLPRRTAGPDFSNEDYDQARATAEKVVRATLGEETWAKLGADGYLDVPSRRHPGLSYRLRPGHRIEVLVAPGVQSPWRCRYLCVEPVYPLPDIEFLAHTYIYARDAEDRLLEVAVEHQADALLGTTF
jgi:hypothetical protein